MNRWCVAPRGGMVYFVTALLSLLIALCAMALCGVWPFGGEFLSCLDNQQQVASDFGYLRQLLSGRSDLFWSYACGGVPHSSVHPTFGNLLSPLVWLVAIVPHTGVLPKLSLLLLLQVAILPLGALFYLRKTFPHLSIKVAVTLSLGYAFSSFLYTKYSFLPFLNVALLFPFFLYGLDCLLNRGRWCLYLILLTCMMTVGPYFAYMYVLFAILYAAGRAGWRWKSRVRQHHGLLLVISLLCLALSSWSWLPSLVTTSVSARVGHGSLLHIISTPGIDVRALSIWLFPVFSLAVILFSANRKNVLQGRYGLTCVGLLLALALAPVSHLWHVSIPIGFSGRFAYMPVMMLTCMAAQASIRPRGISRKAWYFSLPFACMAIGGAVVAAYWHQLMKREYSGLAFSAGELLWLPAFYIVSYGFVCRKLWLSCVVSVLIAVPVFSCYMTYWVNRGHYEPDNDYAQLEHMDFVDQFLATRNVGDGFQGRVSAPDFNMPLNTAFFCSLDTVSHFRATQHFSHIATRYRWGYLNRLTIMYDDGGTIFSDTLFATRYYVVRGKGYEHRLKLLAKKGDVLLYENPWYFGAGLMLSEQVHLEPGEGKSPVEVQQHAIASILGDGSCGKVEPCIAPAHLRVPKWAYAYSEHCLALRPSTLLPSERPMYRERPALRLLPACSGVSVEAFGTTKPVPFSLFTIDESSLDALKGYAEELPVRISYAGRVMDIEATSTAERSQLFLPFMWSPGYTAHEGEQELEIRNNGGFVCIMMPEPGHHCVRLVWHRPHSVIAWVGTVFGGVMTLLLSLYGRRTPLAAPSAWNSLCHKELLLAGGTCILGPILLTVVRFVVESC